MKNWPRSEVPVSIPKAKNMQVIDSAKAFFEGPVRRSACGRIERRAMPLVPGTSPGSYEILALIDAGGMGEVYRARDTKLKRDVALKVLPSAFASDPKRMARFQREAEVSHIGDAQRLLVR